MAEQVYVKPSDVISAPKLLKLLSDTVTKIRDQVAGETDEKKRYALGGAAEMLVDLHNVLLEEIKKQRLTETFEDPSDRGDGHFDA